MKTKIEKSTVLVRKSPNKPVNKMIRNSIEICHLYERKKIICFISLKEIFISLTVMTHSYYA